MTERTVKENEVDDDIIVVEKSDDKESQNYKSEYINEITDTLKAEKKIDPSKIQLTDYEQSILDKINDDIGKSFFNSLTKDQKEELIFRYDEKMENKKIKLSQKKQILDKNKDKIIISLFDKIQEIGNDPDNYAEFEINFRKLSKEKQIDFIKMILDIPIEKYFYIVQLLKQECVDDNIFNTTLFNDKMKEKIYQLVFEIKSIKEVLSDLPEDYKDKAIEYAIGILSMIINLFKNIKENINALEISEENINIPIPKISIDINVIGVNTFHIAKEIVYFFIH